MIGSLALIDMKRGKWQVNCDFIILTVKTGLWQSSEFIYDITSSIDSSTTSIISPSDANPPPEETFCSSVTSSS